MKRLWAPWRMEYIKKVKQKDCFLCRIIKEKRDKKNFVLLRTKRAISVLNIYPYNNGHIMVVPTKHTKSLEKLGPQDILEIFHHINTLNASLKSSMQPQGFNVGLNLGKVAGAGEARHLHVHIVPRWSGDTNFMPLIGDTKIIPQSLRQTYIKIKKILDG